MRQLIDFAIFFRIEICSISLKIKCEKRNIKVKQLPVTIKKEPEPQKKPINSLFGASTSKPKPTTDTAPKVKEEKISPKKESPQKKQNNKPIAQQGKSSIATFFSAKPATNAKASTSIAQATSDIQKIKIKEESSAQSKDKEEKVKESAKEKVKEKTDKATKSAKEEQNATITSSSERTASNKRSHPKTSGELPGLTRPVNIYT